MGCAAAALSAVCGAKALAPAAEPEAAESEAAEPEAAEAGETDDTTARVAWFKTAKVKADLASLGYTETEVEAMLPDVARVVTEKRLRRPASGMPAEWKDGKRKSLPRRALKASSKWAGSAVGAAKTNPRRSAAVAVVGTGLALASTLLGSAGAGRAAAEAAPVPVEAAAAPAAPKSSGIAERSWRTVPASNESGGRRAMVQSSNPLDNSWLDRAITAFVHRAAGLLFGRR